MSIREQKEIESSDSKPTPDPAGKITLVPRGSLGERLRAVASTIAVARKYVRPLEIIWFQTEDFEAPSNRLFTLDPQMGRESITIRDAKWSDWLYNRYPDKGNAWLSMPYLLLSYDNILTDKKIKELKKESPDKLDQIFRKRHCRLFIQTGLELARERNMYAPLLPNIEVINVRNSRLSSWHNNIVGIHIDRDSALSMQDSPIELFIKRMHEIVVADQTTSFFVTTTSHDERERLQTLYSSRIVAPSSMSDGTSVEGLIEIFGDLLALSQTVQILTTPNSAYTEVAAAIGHVRSEALSIYSSPTIITSL